MSLGASEQHLGRRAQGVADASVRWCAGAERRV